MLKSQTAVEAQNAPWAVISYVQADLAWSEWLYFTLNGFPAPKSLAAHATRHGFALPETLTLFPDPDDSSCVSHFSDALASTRYLILICSSHSAHCAEMDRHIREFKKAGGEERILALVVEGEPGEAASLPASDEAGWLPPWLRWRLGSDGTFQDAERSEPQVIDARNGRAGLDDLMASLLSALLDVPRSEFDRLNGPGVELSANRTEQLLSDGGSAVERKSGPLAPGGEMKAGWARGKRIRQRILRQSRQAVLSLFAVAIFFGAGSLWQNRVAAARQSVTAMAPHLVAATEAAAALRAPATFARIAPPREDANKAHDLVKPASPAPEAQPAPKSPELAPLENPIQTATAQAPANLAPPHYAAAMLANPARHRVLIHR